MTARQLAAFAAKMGRSYGERQAGLVRPAAEIVPSGSIAVDWALREGGFRRGRIYELVGVKDAGKSSLVLSAAVNYQRMFPDLGVVYEDIEGTFKPAWATAIGVDCSKRARQAGRWNHPFPPDSETASDMAREWCASGLASLIIVDSIGGLESKKALDKDAEKDLVGKNAQVITRMSKHLATLARDNGVTILLVNQYRANPGSMMSGDVSAGPKAMQHATTAKIEMAQVFAQGSQRKGAYWGEEEVTGRLSRARVSRLKTGASSRVAEFWINSQATEEHGPQGIDSAHEHLKLGVRLKAIDQQPGGYYVMPGGDRLHGEAAVLTRLRASQEARDEVRAAIPFEDPKDEDEDEEGTP